MPENVDGETSVTSPSGCPSVLIGTQTPTCETDQLKVANGTNTTLKSRLANGPEICAQAQLVLAGSDHPSILMSLVRNPNLVDEAWPILLESVMSKPSFMRDTLMDQVLRTNPTCPLPLLSPFFESFFQQNSSMLAVKASHWRNAYLTEENIKRMLNPLRGETARSPDSSRLRNFTNACKRLSLKQPIITERLYRGEFGAAGKAIALMLPNLPEVYLHQAFDDLDATTAQFLCLRSALSFEQQAALSRYKECHKFIAREPAGPPDESFSVPYLRLACTFDTDPASQLSATVALMNIRDKVGGEYYDALVATWDGTGEEMVLAVNDL